ncbi:MAG: hypothetical protein EXQ88_06010 [Alphaproteobacteria bacterium]|nr:hypothetical protein [Alphaproteobacteria bacterium]
MASDSPKLVPFEEARLLADYYLIRDDLDFVIACCDRLLKLDLRRWFEVEPTALIIAALITYGRCFGTGVRERLNDDDVGPEESEHRTFHDHFLALRDRHIAHSVNDYENCGVTIHIAVEASSGQVQRGGLGHNMSRAAALSTSGAQELLNIASDILQGHVMAKVTQLEGMVKEKLAATSDADLLGYNEGFAPVAGRANAGDTRDWPPRERKPKRRK